VSKTESLDDRFRATTAEHRRDPAITFLDARLDGVTYTFEALFSKVDAMASACSAAGVDPGSLVGVLLGGQEEQVLHYLALLRAGAVPAILTPPNRKLHPEYYAETMSKVLDRGRFASIVTDADLTSLATLRRRPFSFEPWTDRPTAVDTVEIPDDISFLQFSSGTTGIKRGVLVQDEAVLAQLAEYGKAIGLEDDDRIVSWLPLYHDMGFIACLNLPLAHGVHTMLMDPIDWVANPSLLLRAISEHGGTLSWNPNFAYSFIAQRCRDSDVADVRLSSLRGLVNCSEPVSHESQERFRERFSTHGLPGDVFMGCYAMAESTFALTHGRESDPGYLDTAGPGGARISVGRPLAGVDLDIRDQDGAHLGEREVGEIWVRSPFTFSGYHNDSTATKEAFNGNWYRTGDLGYFANGEWFVIGRAKDVLIVGGVNVYPQDVEAVVGEVAGIQSGRVVAFSWFDERIQTERVVILAESGIEGATARSVVIEARQRVLAAVQLANFDVQLVPRGSLIKSSSGKIARRANQERWLIARADS
jgi:fatty-acyl-CoA synthase